MQGMGEKRPLSTGEEAIFSIRCSQCGDVIHSGRELVVDDKQTLCEDATVSWSIRIPGAISHHNGYSRRSKN